MDQLATKREIREAIKKGCLSDVVELLDTSPSLLHIQTTFGTWLHMAAAHGKMNIVAWLLSKHVDVNAVGGVGERRAIDEAAANGHCEVVKFLIDAGAELDSSRSDRNPLFAAIVGGMSEHHTEAARALIEGGIDTEARYPNLDNMNVSDFARQWGRIDIVRLLDDTEM